MTVYTVQDIYFIFLLFFLRSKTNFTSVDHVTWLLTVRTVGWLSEPVISRTGQVPRLRRVITSYHDAVLATTHRAVLTLRVHCTHPAARGRCDFRTAHGCQNTDIRQDEIGCGVDWISVPNAVTYVSSAMAERPRDACCSTAILWLTESIYSSLESSWSTSYSS